jgi:CRP-like cAMP-binding protein
MESTGLSRPVHTAARDGDRTVADRERWLKRILNWLPEERVRELAAVGKIEHVRARSIINVNRDVVRFVLRGAVRLQFAADPQSTTVISILGPGDMISKLFFKEAPRVSAQALTDCALLSLPRKPFLDAVLGNSSEQLDKAVYLIFGEALNLLARYWQTQGGRLMVRLSAVLLELARKFGCADSRGTLIDLKLAQKDLAMMIGCSRQQLHALMEELTQRRIVTRQERRLILDVGELKRLARKG